MRRCPLNHAALLLLLYASLAVALLCLLLASQQLKLQLLR
jgi:hypothetical protein